MAHAKHSNDDQLNLFLCFEFILIRASSLLLSALAQGLWADVGHSFAGIQLKFIEMLKIMSKFQC